MEKSILEYIHAHGGAMNAFNTFIAEHQLDHPVSHLFHELPEYRARLSALRPLDRLHHVFEYISKASLSIHGYFPEHAEQKCRNP